MRDNPVNVTKQGLVNKTHLKRINATLTQSEPLDDARDETRTGRLRFLRTLLMICQLLQIKNDTLVPAPNSEAFFLRPLAERVKATFDGYRQTNSWDELLRIPELNIQGRRATDADAWPFVVNARQTVLRALGNQAGEGWQDAARLQEFFFRRHYEFLLPRQASSWTGISNPYTDYGNSMGWNFQSEQEWRGPNGQFYETYRETLNEEQGWDFVEGAFIAAILCEPLHWMGLLDLGVTPDETAPGGARLTAFRLTAQGAHALQGKPLPKDAEPSGGRLIIQPTFEVLAYPPVQETHLALLDRIADRERLDQAAVYRLSRESIYRARQQHGMASAEVIATLERESGASLPQNVAYTLHEWGRAQDRVLMYDNLVLVQADAALLDQLASADDTLLARRLTPSSALVYREAQQRVEDALFALGCLPVLHSAPPLPVDQHTPAAPYLDVEPDGLVCFRPGAPRIYLKRVLARLTVETGADLRVTAAQVQQAVHDGLAVEQIIALLASWCGGMLPAALEQSIKAWGGFFGGVSLERPLLLRLSDERTLAALQDDPEIGALLRPYQPEGVLAQVDPNDLRRLRKLLAARGIDLDDSRAK